MKHKFQSFGAGSRLPAAVMSGTWVLAWVASTIAAGFTRPTPHLVAGGSKVPSANVVYVATTGNDASGNGSIASPYKTLEKAHNHGGLGAGWTIVLRGGTYPRTAPFMPTKSGTSGNPISVMAYPGETVILDRSPEFARFRTPGQGNWELHNASLHIWRSKTAGEFSGGRLQGAWKEGSQYYELWGYLADGGWGDGSNYFGPMARAQADGRLYVRFQKPLPSYTGTGWPDYVDGVSGGVFAIPSSQDPNDFPIYLYRRGSATGATAVYHINGASWWTFRDINVFDSDVITVFDGTCNGVNFERGLWLACRYGNRFLTGTTDKVSWRGLQIASGAINYWRWHWIKDGTGSGQMDDNGGWNYTGASAADHTIEDCRVWNFFDVIGGRIPPPSNFVVRYNWFDNCRDDCIQLPQNSNGIEWAYNVFYNTPFWGMSCATATPSTGNVYIHHNVAWQHWPAFWNAGDRPGCNKMVISHSSTPGVQPCKIYNNTLIVNSCASTGWSISLAHCDTRRANSSSNPHEAYNNLLMVYADDLWYNGENGASEHDQGAVRYCLDGTSNEKYDYNHFARVLAYAGAKSALIGPMLDHPGVGSYRFDHASQLAAAAANKIGAEQHGTDEDHAGVGVSGMRAASPLVDIDALDFRPKTGSALATGAKDLASTSWHGAGSTAWRGALDPAGAGNEIGPRPSATDEVVPPSSLTYSDNPVTYDVNVAIQDNKPSFTGTVESFTVSPALPAGLALNKTTGVISGTPTTASQAADCTVRASNSAGSCTAVVNITVKSDLTVLPGGSAGTLRRDGRRQTVRSEIIGMDGRIVLRAENAARPGDIPSLSLPAGVYLVREWREGQPRTFRLVATEIQAVK